MIRIFSRTVYIISILLQRMPAQKYPYWNLYRMLNLFDFECVLKPEKT